MKVVLKYIRKMIPTLLIIGATVILSYVAYYNIMHAEEEKCWDILDDSAKILNDEIKIVFDNNVNILKLASGAMVQEDRVESYDAIVSHIDAFQHMTIFNRIDVLYPDDTMLLQTGEKINTNTAFSFSEIASKGEHMSNRLTDVKSGEQVINYYVPVVKGDETLAILVGVIECMKLPSIFNATIYDGRAISCIVDYSDGSFVMDDWHDELTNMFEMKQRKALKDYEDVDLIGDVREAKTGVIAFASKVNGLNSYMYYTPVGIFTWELLLVFQEDVVFESLLNLKNILISVAIVEACLLMIYFFWNLFNVNQLSKSKREAEKQLQTSTILVECVTELTFYLNIDEAIHNLLGIINRYFKGNRIYLFKIDYDRQTISNSYEYVSEGFKKQINYLQNISIEVITPLLEKFIESGIFYTSNINKEWSMNSKFSEIAVLEEMNSLIAVPLIEEEKIVGFIGINNPTLHVDELSLLSSIRFFIMDSLSRKQVQETLTELSYHDALTNIFNRNKFQEVITEHKDKIFEKIGVAYFDINGLKKINDQLGHNAGDNLIRNAGAGINTVFPKNAYRIGGDEFVVIIPNIEQDAFEKRMDEVHAYMEEHQISISYGTAWNECGNNIEAQLKMADEMMYKNKESYYHNAKNRRKS